MVNTRSGTAATRNPAIDLGIGYNVEVSANESQDDLEVIELLDENHRDDEVVSIGNSSNGSLSHMRNVKNAVEVCYEVSSDRHSIEKEDDQNDDSENRGGTVEMEGVQISEDDDAHVIQMKPCRVSNNKINQDIPETANDSGLSDDEAPVEITSKHLPTGHELNEHNEDNSVFSKIQRRHAEQEACKQAKLEKRRIKRKKISPGSLAVKINKSQFNVVALDKKDENVLNKFVNFKSDLLSTRTADRRFKHGARQFEHRLKWAQPK